MTKLNEFLDGSENNVYTIMAELGSVCFFADVLWRAMGEKAASVGSAGKKVAEESFDVAKQAKNLVVFLSTD